MCVVLWLNASSNLINKEQATNPLAVVVLNCNQGAIHALLKKTLLILLFLPQTPQAALSHTNYGNYLRTSLDILYNEVRLQLLFIFTFLQNQH